MKSKKIISFVFGTLCLCTFMTSCQENIPQEQKDWEVIESQIEALEEKAAGLDSQIEAAASDFVKLRQLMDEKSRLEAELEEKMERWMYLNDLAEQIAKENAR